MEYKFSIKRLLCLFPIIGDFFGFAMCVVKPFCEGQFFSSLCGAVVIAMTVPFVKKTMMIAMGGELCNKEK